MDNERVVLDHNQSLASITYIANYSTVDVVLFLFDLVHRSTMRCPCPIMIALLSCREYLRTVTLHVARVGGPHWHAHVKFIIIPTIALWLTFELHIQVYI